jgi:hypothetical protein
MAVLRLKYINDCTDRVGVRRYYFRKGTIRVALPGLPGTPVFGEKYDELPAHLRLREHLAKTGIDSDDLLTEKLGKGPFTRESLGNMIRSLAPKLASRAIPRMDYVT